MERQLPLIDIEGTKFTIDVVNDALIQIENPENRINFYELRDWGNEYVMLYDLETKNLADEHQDLPYDESLEKLAFSDYGTGQLEDFDEDELDDNVKTIRIPPLTQLDPEGMSNHYHVSLAEIQSKTDWEIIVNPYYVKNSLNGRMSSIDIMGKLFYIDIQKECLWSEEVSNPAGLKFKDMMEIGEEGYYQFFYHTKKFEIIQLETDFLTAIPKDIYMIEIPNENLMDSIGWAMAGGWNIKEEARRFPPQKNLTAKVISWEELGIPELIAKNTKENVGKNQNKTTKKPGRRI